MEKPTFRRLSLGFVQHMAAVFAAVLLLMVVINLQVRVENMYGESRKYVIDPFEGAPSFEDSGVFNSLFSSAVNDLTILVVIRGQLETNGVFVGTKPISVTDFVNRKGLVSTCPVTVSYKLEDLIKWSKQGVEMRDCRMTLRDFVTYFDPKILDMSNFYLDQNDRLTFDGEGYIASRTEATRTELTKTESDEVSERASAVYDAAQNEVLKEGQNWADYSMLEEKYTSAILYNEELLIEPIFNFLQANMDKKITLSSDEDGNEMVHFQLLNDRYDTVEGYESLTDAADNWIEYGMLENNVTETIESIGINYGRYANRNDLYMEENTNLLYLFRLETKDGPQIYTNLSMDFHYADEEQVNEIFQGLGRYTIFSMEDMTSEGNVDITEQEIYRVLKDYEYAYPESTKVWIGVDTGYWVEDDQFAMVRNIYNRIVPHIWQIGAVILACGAVWLAIWLYLTVTAGRAVDEEGRQILYLNGFDRLFTEFVLAIGVLLAVIGLYGFAFLESIAGDRYYMIDNVLTTAQAKVSEGGYRYIYGLGALYGFMASLTFSAMWYSLVRRVKSGNLWRDSFLHWIWSKIADGASMVMYHRNTAIRTLIPYNLFLLVNLAGLVCAYLFRYTSWLFMGAIAGVLVFDALTGVILFRKNAEMVEIVEGIRRIRQGEVDYKLDVEKLHGENREMAEAVNNIGEGIRNAVATSVKDERMKTDLITNVSHDIKTPLTSIINYVDLLKRQKIENETVKSYIEILDSKSQRLKQLTDDLVEASKISSGNIILMKEKLNLTELLNQSIGEFSEKFEQRSLQVVFNDPVTPACIHADSRRMWRVIENLFNNICKYAMPGTRVYLDLEKANDLIEVSIKNISEYQLNISPEELTERFIRGDLSRTTEGSGLGLSIARSLVEVQGGSFRIHLDGDLFKAVIRFPEYVEEARPEGEQAEEDAAGEDDGEDDGVEESAVTEKTDKGKTDKGNTDKGKTDKGNIAKGNTAKENANASAGDLTGGN